MDRCKGIQAYRYAYWTGDFSKNSCKTDLNTEVNRENFNDFVEASWGATATDIALDRSNNITLLVWLSGKRLRFNAHRIKEKYISLKTSVGRKKVDGPSKSWSDFLPKFQLIQEFGNLSKTDYHKSKAKRNDIPGKSQRDYD